MSRGKYSPNLPKQNFDAFVYNADKKIPPVFDGSIPFDPRLHMGCYDSEGFDSYGYSGFDIDENYVGIGDGIDRNGITEYEYMVMDDEEFENYV